MTSQFPDMTAPSIFWCCFIFLVNFSYWSKFHVTIHRWFWNYEHFFIRDWLEIRKSKIPTSDFCPISGDWDKLEIPNFARMSLINFYCQCCSFYCFWVIKGKQMGGKLPPPPTTTTHPPRLGLKVYHLLRKSLEWSLFYPNYIYSNILIILSLHRKWNFPLKN